MKRRELREAAEVATRAFDDYEYFTNWFPEKQSRNRIQFALLWREFRTNFRASQYLVCQFPTIAYGGKTMGSWSVKKKLY